MSAEALLDSNVVIAAVAEAHEHHAASLALFIEMQASFAVSAHSYAEIFSALTRQGERAPFRFSPAEAWAVLESIRTVTVLAGLTPAQTFDTVRGYAASGGIGARLYDRLIGEAAVIHGIPALVTWNTAHMRGLFPGLWVSTPRQFVQLRHRPSR